MTDRPTLAALIEWAKTYTMSEAEMRQQQASWVRGMTARCEHGEADFEQCPACRNPAD